MTITFNKLICSKTVFITKQFVVFSCLVCLTRWRDERERRNLADVTFANNFVYIYTHTHINNGFSGERGNVKC